MTDRQAAEAIRRNLDRETWLHTCCDAMSVDTATVLLHDMISHEIPMENRVALAKAIQWLGLIRKQ